VTTEEIYTASDYAGIDAGDFRFYYGYEQTDADDNWLFVAHQNGKKIMSYTAEQLGGEDTDPPRDILMRGIARYFCLASK